MVTSRDPSNIEELINRQVKIWEVQQRLAAEGGEAARSELAHLSQGPWITVSKQLGSGGARLAEQIAGELGWQAFNKEILTTIARRTHSRERLLSELDEHAIGRWRDFLHHVLVPGSMSQFEFLKEMMQVIWALARQGRVVLVGRGANWLLEPEYGLRVRVVAPLEQRIENVMDWENLTRAKARRRVEKEDADHEAFIRKVYQRSIDDSLGYDLVLNLGALGEAAAVQAVSTALRTKLSVH